MQYLGGKARQAKRIATHIVPYINEGLQYVEPFVGAGSVMSAVCKSSPCVMPIAGDSNVAVITLHKAIQKGWQPPEAVSREMYYDVKANPCNYHPAMEAFVAIGCSFAGKWWGGYAKVTVRNYARTARHRLFNLHANMEYVQFIATDYRRLPIFYQLSECVVYCDPPYANTISYAGSGKFDSEQFWQWCVSVARWNNIVLVSEYNIPEWVDCEVVDSWERKQSTSNKYVKKHKRIQNKRTIESLYLIKGDKNEGKT